MFVSYSTSIKIMLIFRGGLLYFYITESKTPQGLSKSLNCLFMFKINLKWGLCDVFNEVETKLTGYLEINFVTDLIKYNFYRKN